MPTTITPKSLSQTDLTTTSETVCYTATGVTTTLSAIIVHNRTTSAVTVTMHHRLSADGSTGTKNQFYKIALPSEQTFVANIAKIMSPGDSIRVTAQTANAVTVHLDGIEAAA